jgi:hypothetical protein
MHKFFCFLQGVYVSSFSFYVWAYILVCLQVNIVLVYM